MAASLHANALSMHRDVATSFTSCGTHHRLLDVRSRHAAANHDAAVLLSCANKPFDVLRVRESCKQLRQHCQTVAANLLEPQTVAAAVAVSAWQAACCMPKMGVTIWCCSYKDLNARSSRSMLHASVVCYMSLPARLLHASSLCAMNESISCQNTTALNKRKGNALQIINK